MKTQSVLTVLFLLALSVSAANTNRPNEITTNVTNLIVNVSAGQVIFEPDVNLTSGFYWGGLTGFLNNDTVLWANASNIAGRVIVLEGRPLVPNIDAANITSGVIDAARLPDNSAFFNNVTMNISGLQDNIGVVTTNISQLWTNASGVQSRIASLNFQGVPYWIDSGGLISVNNSINSGNIRVQNITLSNTITNIYSNNNNAIPFIQMRDYLSAGFGINEFCIMPPDSATTSKMCFRANNASIFPKTVSLTSTTADVFSIITSVGNVSFVPGGAIPSVLPTGNKAVQLGSSTASFDNCYCDDHVTTPKDSVSLTENNKGQYTVLTVGSVFDDDTKKSTEIMRVTNTDPYSKGKAYPSYMEALRDFPFNEGDGTVDYYNIPPMFSDKMGHNDTASDFSLIMGLRGALLEKDKEIKDLRARLDKLEGVKNG